MFYDKKAQVLTKESVSDGMGGWIDDDEPTLVTELAVRRAPVTAETVLKQYGIVSTTAIKLYTENTVPKGDNYIQFEKQDYRILQNTEYDIETILLLELM